MLYGLSRSGTEFLIGGPGLASLIEGINRTAQEVDRGTPFKEAAALGIVTSVGTYVGAKIPIKLPLIEGAGPGIVQRAVTGGLSNLGVSLAQQA